MDSTVIATSLPAIAADIGTSPLDAQARGHLLSAVARGLHPGERLDRRPLRRPHGVPRRDRGVHARLDRLRAVRLAHASSSSPASSQGMGGAMMTPVGRLVLVRSVDRRELVNAMAWVTIPALIGPAARPAARRLHHHLHLLALDLPDQHADRAARHRAGDASSSRTCGRETPDPFDARRRAARRARHRRARVRRLGARARFPAAGRSCSR